MKSLLKVTRKAELGLLLASELALHPGELVSLEAVSKKTGASRKFLEQVAGELRRADIVEAQRGAAGGYRLARDPKTLTIAEVLNAVEGPMEIDACTAHAHEHAEIGIITKVQGQVMATLMNTTVADLA
ncbi:MAG TPA: Rrf2 family transcriptional regulator [Patescibacteria group bacterium]|nr:Rrf2 family transcriptional regulator [Patescibacteria group bacterium]